ncbi:unnamed protein product, partial [Discosporangium mesarthrocarpum]
MVHHYAGEIVYETEGFLEKNRDMLHQEGIDLLKSSTSGFIRGFGDRCGGTFIGNQSEPSPSVSSNPLPLPLPLPPLSLKSVGAQFKNQLNNLLAAIGETHPHYVRCLKPNDANVRSNFDLRRITSQLAHGGKCAGGGARSQGGVPGPDAARGVCKEIR